MKAYVATSGSYSDYIVHAVFEEEADANEYVLRLNENGQRADHENPNHQGDPYGRTEAKFNHTDPFETCPHYACTAFRESPTSWTYRIEDFDYYPAGIVPALKVEA